MVFQNFGLFPHRTILENAGYGLEVQGIDKKDIAEKATNALKMVGLEGYIQNNKIDIISLTTRRRNLVARLINPSVGKKMLFHTNTPILMFHA